VDGRGDWLGAFELSCPGGGTWPKRGTGGGTDLFIYECRKVAARVNPGNYILWVPAGPARCGEPAAELFPIMHGAGRMRARRRCICRFGRHWLAPGPRTISIVVSSIMGVDSGNSEDSRQSPAGGTRERDWLRHPSFAVRPNLIAALSGMAAFAGTRSVGCGWAISLVVAGVDPPHDVFSAGSTGVFFSEACPEAKPMSGPLVPLGAAIVLCEPEASWRR